MSMTMQEAYHTMLEEAGICPECKEYKPCGCHFDGEEDCELLSYPSGQVDFDACDRCDHKSCGLVSNAFDYADEKRRSEGE